MLIDPDGTLGSQWLFVVVHALTGVFYHQQYGGTATRQGAVEGYLVPLAAPGPLTTLRQLFEQTLKSAGAQDYRWPQAHTKVLMEAVSGIPYWTSDGVNEQRGFLSLDTARWTDVDEAWLPVSTPDGPGTLIWQNSD